MNPYQFFKFALGGLWRQKVRTALSLVGVCVGACALAFSLALGIGLRAFIDTEFQSRDEFWRVTVRADDRKLTGGATDAPPPEVDARVPEARRDRLRARLIERRNMLNPPRYAKPLLAADLVKLGHIADVREVRAFHLHEVRAWLTAPDAPARGLCASGPLGDLAPRVLAGQLPASAEAREVVLSEFAAYELGARDDAQLAALVGRELQVELPVYGDARKDEKPVRGAFRVCAVVRGPNPDERTDRWSSALDRADVMLPTAAGAPLFAALFGEREGYPSAELRARPGSDLQAIVDAVEAQGFVAHSSLRWYHGEKQKVTLIATGLNLFALLALVVAAVGITNTLVTSVLERTREIGVLRAVGATRRQIIVLFLLEGALVGALGAALGLALARGLSVWGDGFVKRLIQQQMNGQPMVSETVFDFQWWVWTGTLAFAVLVTTLAALYPARRAARVNPIEALRHS
jgi:putative ABC transport system permease protein